VGVGDRPLLFGVPVDPITMDETVERCAELIDSRRPVQHVVMNAGKVVLMEDDPRLRQIIAACPLDNADGMSIVWAGRALGLRFPERVAGIDLMARLLAVSEQRGWPAYFVGARDEVLRAFADVVRGRYPRLIIAGMQHGYFEDDPAIAGRIADSGARVVFVAMPSPRKEYFIAEQLPRMGDVFAMGVGGSFDVWSGVCERAPRWMQKVGLEWLFRLIQEPRKMWRRTLIGNARFTWLFLRELVHRSPGPEDA
jgi:N-acetylglucosaminyldiphosphoundecaprenol N-acetyl-beta-D-mannosaminyltransferase